MRQVIDTVGHGPPVRVMPEIMDIDRFRFLAPDTPTILEEVVLL
jgi:hypothetical protein